MAFRPEFRIQSATERSESRIVVGGDLDGGAAAVIVDEFELAITDAGIERLTLDMREISFIDSAGMRAIIEIEQAARERGLPLVVLPPPAHITELLRSTGLTERMTLGPQLDAPDDDGEFVERVELRLPRNTTAPVRARAELREATAECDGDQGEIAVLLTSELVTNAVIHPSEDTPDEIGLRIVTAGSRIRVEVTDRGEGFDPKRPEPRPPERGGRGLLLVDQLASRWGARRRNGDGDPFEVWFELDLG